MLSGGSQSLALDRRKQINTLLIFNENVSEVSPDHRYRIDFTAGNQPLVMLIELSPKFPNERPSIRIEPPGMSHPWLDAGGNVVGAPGLISYSAHSDLGRVVQAIKRDLERKPPVKVQYHSGQNYMNGAQYPPSSQPALGAHYPSVRLPAYQLPQQPQHPVPQRNVIAELKDLSQAELEELNTDSRALQAFTKTLQNPAMDSVESKIQTTRDSVSKLVEQNRGLCDQVKSKKSDLDQRLSDHQMLIGEVKELEDRVEAARSQNTLATIGDILKTQCFKDEEESESCAERYLQGDVSTDEFLSDYIKLRSQHHQKKAKLDDVLQTNRQLQQYGGGQPYPTWRY